MVITMPAFAIPGFSDYSGIRDVKTVRGVSCPTRIPDLAVLDDAHAWCHLAALKVGNRGNPGLAP